LPNNHAVTGTDEKNGQNVKYKYRREIGLGTLINDAKEIE
jgi:hypothetical protein